MMNTANKQKWAFILAVMLPYLAGYLLFTLYPNVLSAYYSFFEWDGVSDMKFVGFENYIELFQDRYVWRALMHNVIIALVVPLITLMIASVLAYTIVYSKYWERNIHKIIYFLPNVISSVVDTK